METDKVKTTESSNPSRAEMVGNKQGKANPVSSPGGVSKTKQKKRGSKTNSKKLNRVAQTTRSDFSRILEQFKNSNESVYTFEDNLKKQERAAVHVLCARMGMSSKSSGKGDKRRVSVYKARNEVDTLKRKEDIVSFVFSDAAKGVIQDLFSQYPPDDAEITGNKVGETSIKTNESQAIRDDMFWKPELSKSEIADKVQSLASRIEKSTNLRQINEERSKLPIASFRDVITSTIESHQVVLICGETGCGKTTQVPQFLLDHAWSKGETCKIVCTQPRRISAMSVAERIATERGENVGDSVGYKIRLESKGGRHSSLVFCTNGVMLKILVSKGPKAKGKRKKKASKKLANGVSDITHIIVDEIHERDRFSDFMLAIIREILPLYPHLRVVLMSATIDAERFSKYFGECPIIRVPGFTYPVKSFYLEDVLSIVRSTENNHLAVPNDSMEDSILTEESKVALDEAIDLALSSDEFGPLVDLMSSEEKRSVFNYQHSKTGVTPLMVFAGKGRIGDICMLLSLGVDCNVQSIAGNTAFDYAEQENQREAAEIIKKHMEKTFTYSDEEQKLLDKYLTDVDPQLIDCVLIQQLLRKICNDSKDGAILVFLPGWDDIRRTQEKLHASPFFKDSSKFMIISLHSMIPSEEQKKVFKRPPPGCRKIILSTNIAETSVTIDDVVYVLDSGRMKEKSYDPVNNMSTLHSNWISKASAKQRAGRAGRCQPGFCYHLYSKLRATSLPDYQVPEIKRMPIEELCLQVKLIDPSCKIEEFLQKTLDPPVYMTIRNAIIALQDIGALSGDEKLTDLGEKLGSLPVHPRTSKMLFVAISLNCLDPALTLACAADYKDPFISPILPDEKKKATAARLELASFYGGNGDQLAIIAAFEFWRMAKSKGEESKFCSKYFISQNTMSMISRMRKQLEAELIRNGLIPEGAPHCSLNSGDPGILNAVLLAGLYPKIGKVIPQGKRSLIETENRDKVKLHPGSVNGKLSFQRSPQSLVMFDEITCGDQGLYIRNCSIIGSLPLLLLAKEIVVAPSSDHKDGEADDASNDLPNSQHGQKIMSSPENLIKVFVDRWLPFESTALDIAQIYCLRERLSSAILFKITHPRKGLPEHLGASMHALACILSYDGMSGISLPTMDLLATRASAAGTRQANHWDYMATNQVSDNYLKSLIDYHRSISFGQTVYEVTNYSNNNGLPFCAPPPISAVVMSQPQNLSSEVATVTPHEVSTGGTNVSNRRRRKRRLRHDQSPISVSQRGTAPVYEVTNHSNNTGLPFCAAPPISAVVMSQPQNHSPQVASVTRRGFSTKGTTVSNRRKRKRMLPYSI